MSVRVLSRDQVAPGAVELPDGDDVVPAAVLAVAGGATVLRAGDVERARRAVHVTERIAACRRP
jgi:hypothetical protein